MGQILLAREEAQEWPPLERDVVADGSAQHGIPRLERIENRALRDWTFDFEFHVATNLSQASQMRR